MDVVKGNLPPIRPPDRRVLRAFAFDPMSTRLSGRYLSVSVPFEVDLEPGPDGELVQVIDFDAVNGVWYQPVDLNDPFLLAQDGLRPSESDPRSHQQVVYAVAMSVIERFQRFTGRRFRWRGDRRLRIVPHAFYGRNAYFDPTRGAILFGYFRADDSDSEANLPNQLMFTCLSVDVVAHEVTHAIVNRVRKYFTVATNPDVFAFHEAFADLVALFHHFLFPEVVEDAVAGSRSDLEEATALLSLADEFGRATGRGGPLRSAVGSTPKPEVFLKSVEPHERGAIFVAAVFDAYLETFRSQIADLRRLATGGSGILATGSLSPDLVHRVSAEAVKNADRVLGMVVRAFDFLPVVDVTFGDVVRSIITADRDLYPDDAMHLRGNLVEAFRRRGIYPPGVTSLADQALVWRAPVTDLSLIDDVRAVDLSQLIIDSTLKLDPSGQTQDPEDSEVQARSRGVYTRMGAWAGAHCHELGLDPTAGGVEVVGIHVAYPVAVDGQPRPMVVAQLAQRREDLEVGANRDTRTKMLSGTTLIARVDGTVEYLVTKPLPLTNPAGLTELPEPIRGFATAQHRAGQARLERLREWFGEVEDRDPLAVWLTEPSITRLTFANLHLPTGGGA